MPIAWRYSSIRLCFMFLNFLHRSLISALFVVWSCRTMSLNIWDWGILQFMFPLTLRGQFYVLISVSRLLEELCSDYGRYPMFAKGMLLETWLTVPSRVVSLWLRVNTFWPIWTALRLLLNNKSLRLVNTKKGAKISWWHHLLNLFLFVFLKVLSTNRWEKSTKNLICDVTVTIPHFLSYIYCKMFFLLRFSMLLKWPLVKLCLSIITTSPSFIDMTFSSATTVFFLQAVQLAKSRADWGYEFPMVSSCLELGLRNQTLFGQHF